MAENLNQSTTIVVDKIQIISFSASVFPREQRSLSVIFAVGYDDEQGNFHPTETKQAAVTGLAFDALVGSNPDSNLSFYENIKAQLYPLITQNG